MIVSSAFQCVYGVCVRSVWCVSMYEMHRIRRVQDRNRGGAQSVPLLNGKPRSLTGSAIPVWPQLRVGVAPEDCLVFVIGDRFVICEEIVLCNEACVQRAR